MSNSSDNGPVILEGLPTPEEVAATEAESILPPPAKPAAPPAKRRGGFGGTVLGGTIAAALGYGGAAYLGDASWPFRGTDTDTSALTTEIERLSTALKTVEADTAKAASTAEELSALKAELAAQAGAVATLRASVESMPEQPVTQSADITALAERLTALEKAPAADGGVSAPALQAYERELQDLRARIDAQAGGSGAAPAEIAAAAEEATARIKAAEADLTALQTQTAAAAQAATTRAALARLAIAMDVGSDVAGAVAAANAAGAVLTPEAFTAAPTLTDLQRSFPEAARRALAASVRATAGDGIGNKLGAFVKSQFGARSLSPQEGDAPDAVLSRIEAALTTGQVADAVAGIVILPEAGQTELTAWKDQATAYIAARQALDAAMTALPAN